MEERELTQLLQQLGDRVTPGPAPVRRIVDAGEALRGRRSGRVRMFAIAAAAAAVVGGGSVAAVVLDLPLSGGDTQSASGEAADDAGGGAGGGEELVPGTESGGDTAEEDAATAAAVPTVVTPDVAAPGDRVAVEVPPDVAFGAEWSLERSTDGAWESLFVLVDADVARESGEQLYRPADSPETRDDIRELKDGPVTLFVPDTATPGRYRICQTVDDGAEWCGALTVTD